MSYKTLTLDELQQLAEKIENDGGVKPKVVKLTDTKDIIDKNRDRGEELIKRLKRYYQCI